MCKFKMFALVLVAFLGSSATANAETVILVSDDFIGISFWVISMGTLAATVFFFLERGSVASNWKTPVTVVGLITGISFFHYMYMRGVWVQTGDSPTVYRYIDWLITAPLQMIMFYLILAAVRKVSRIIFWKSLEGNVMTELNVTSGISKVSLFKSNKLIL